MTEHDDFAFDEGAGWELDERLADWVDGRLSAAEVEALEREFDADPALRAAAEEYRRTVAMLQETLPAGDDLEPPADLIPAVLDRVVAAPPRRMWMPILGSVAAAAAMFAIFVFLNDQTRAPGFENDGSTARAPEGRPDPVRTPELDAAAGELPFEAAEGAAAPTQQEAKPSARSESANKEADQDKFLAEQEKRAVLEESGKDQADGKVRENLASAEEKKKLLKVEAPAGGATPAAPEAKTKSKSTGSRSGFGRGGLAKKAPSAPARGKSQAGPAPGAKAGAKGEDPAGPVTGDVRSPSDDRGVRRRAQPLKSVTRKPEAPTPGDGGAGSLDRLRRLYDREVRGLEDLLRTPVQPQKRQRRPRGTPARAERAKGAPVAEKRNRAASEAEEEEQRESSKNMDRTRPRRVRSVSLAESVPVLVLTGEKRLALVPGGGAGSQNGLAGRRKARYFRGIAEAPRDITEALAAGAAIERKLVVQPVDKAHPTREKSAPRSYTWQKGDVGYLVRGNERELTAFFAQLRASLVPAAGSGGRRQAKAVKPDAANDGWSLDVQRLMRLPRDLTVTGPTEPGRRLAFVLVLRSAAETPRATGR